MAGHQVYMCTECRVIEHEALGLVPQAGGVGWRSRELEGEKVL